MAATRNMDGATHAGGAGGGTARGGARRVVSRTAAEDARAFRASRRHTLFVRLLRFALPAVALSLFAGYGLLLRASFGVDLGNLKVGKVIVTADDLKMKNPSYFGSTPEGNKYNVRAQEAILDLKNTTGPIRLAGIDGDVTQLNGVITTLKADRGLLDNQKGEIELLDRVDIATTSGMRARMTQAKVFSREGRITSQGSVQAETATGSLTAERMELFNKERRGTFAGNVALRLIQSTAPDAAKAAITTGRDAREPVDIKSEELTIDDGKKFAHFQRQVRVVQGQSSLTSAEMRVTYEGKVDPDALTGGPVTGSAALKPTIPAGTVAADAAKPAASAEPASQISKITATGGVVLVAGPERRITSEGAEFDVKGDTALLTGAVQIQQGRNQLRGRRFFLDRKAGKSRLDSPAERGVPIGRIAATFYQGDANKPVSGKAPPKPAPAAAVVAEAATPFSAFKSDPNAPLDIDAETLEVEDQRHVAIFKGAVRAQQGGFVVAAAEIRAFYTGNAGLASGPETAPKPGEKGGADISRIEASQNVLITSKDGQTARGEQAVFDVKANKATLTGRPVILIQDKNVIECSRLNIDMTTGITHCDNDKIARAPGDTSQVTASGIAVPAPSTAANGQTRMVFFPPGKDAQKKKSLDVQSGAASAPAVPRPPSAGWEPTSSASTVQRAKP